MKKSSNMVTKLFFSLLPVQILLIAIGSINSVIDGVMASNYIGSGAMTVIGLYMPAMKIIETINAVLLGGSQILCGRFLGKNQVDRTRNVFSLDMFLIVSASVLFSLICFIFPMNLARLFGADGANADHLKSYILGMAFGILPQMLCAQLSAFLQMEQQQTRTYIGIGAMMAVNAGLDYLFIVVLKWEMLGLGLATSVSYWVFLLILGAYYFRKKAIIRFEVKGIRWSDLGEMIRIGIPGAIVILCLAIRGFVINAMLLKYSREGVAVLSALNTFGGLLYATTAGLASTTRLLISVYVGEEDRPSIIETMKAALIKGVALVCGVAALVFLLAVPLTEVFYKDPSSEVYYLTKRIFQIYPFCLPLSAICVIFSNYFQSMSRMKIVHVLSVMDGMIGVCLTSLLLAPFFGAVGVWTAHVLNGVYTTLAVIIYARIYHKRFPKTVEDLLAIPDSFGVPSDSRLELEIRGVRDVTNASERIMEFCQRIGIDEKRSYYAGLCLEELAANIVEHGFSDGKPHMAEVHVVNRSDALLLRIKDNCRAFNPKETADMLNPEDITHNIGLRIVQRYAKKMQYNSALGLNVLTIEI